MTADELAKAKAAFLAKGGSVTLAAPGSAYGVDPEADRAKRAEARELRAVRDTGEARERAAERYAESIREAYHTGGRHSAIDAMQSRDFR